MVRPSIRPMRSILPFRPSSGLAGRLAEQRQGLFRLASLWCHDRTLADDLAQEALAKAFGRAHQLRDPASLRPWLYGILVNCWRDHLRARRPTEDIDAIDPQELVVHDDNPETAASRSELVHEVRAAIARLPQTQREVLALVDLEGCSYAEAAEILDIPMGTVMSRLCRSRAALRELITDARSEAAHLRRVK